MDWTTIDWEAIHHRLALASTMISGESADDPDTIRRVLDKRAKAAARPPAAPIEDERLDVLVFSLAGETYAIETCHVREVNQLHDLTPVPCTPSFVAGVMNLRGRILAVIDLRRYFELPDTSLTELNRVIVIADDENEFGLLADSIEGARSIAVAELQDGLPTLSGTHAAFIKGITGQMLAVLDGHRLLADGDLKVNDRVSREADRVRG